MVTSIDAAYVVGFDRDRGQHVVYADGAVVFEDDHVLYAGPTSGYTGTIDTRIDASGCLVSPGLIDAHSLMDQGIRTYSFDRQSEPGMVRPRKWLADPNQEPVFTPEETR